MAHKVHSLNQWIKQLLIVVLSIVVFSLILFSVSIFKYEKLKAKTFVLHQVQSFVQLYDKSVAQAHAMLNVLSYDTAFLRNDLDRKQEIFTNLCSDYKAFVGLSWQVNNDETYLINPNYDLVSDTITSTPNILTVQKDHPKYGTLKTYIDIQSLFEKINRQQTNEGIYHNFVYYDQTGLHISNEYISAKVQQKIDQQLPLKENDHLWFYTNKYAIALSPLPHHNENYDAYVLSYIDWSQVDSLHFSFWIIASLICLILAIVLFSIGMMLSHRWLLHDVTHLLRDIHEWHADKMHHYQPKTSELHSLAAKLHEVHQVDKEYKDKIIHQLMTDELTQIGNRRYLIHILEKDLRKPVIDTPLLLIFADIDYFKRINDTFGHHIGDLVLKKVASLLRIELYNQATICRYGGEEFVIYCKEVNEDTCFTMIEDLRLKVGTKISGAYDKELPPGLSLTMSFGIASYHYPESMHKWLERADMAMYQSKSTGRNKTSLLHHS